MSALRGGGAGAPAVVIGPDGWAREGGAVSLHPSPHFDARPGDPQDVHLAVLHNISLPPYMFHTGVVRAFFCGTLDFDREPDARVRSLRDLRVSSHFLITRRGGIEQFVSCCARAWHAGASSFQGRTRVNDFSIGIELEGSDFVPFEPVQYARLESLLAAIDARFSLQYIVGHSDIAPGRKTDPGPYFDWALLKAHAARFGTPAFPGAAAEAFVSSSACRSPSV